MNRTTMVVITVGLAAVAAGAAATVASQPAGTRKEGDASPAGAAEKSRQSPGAGKAAPPANTNDISAALPPLPRKEAADSTQEVLIPLTTQPPHVWTGIRGGVKTERVDEQNPGLKVSYTRTRGRPAGAALIIHKGDVAGLQSIEFAIRGNQGTRLSIAMQEEDGEVWSTPTFRVPLEAEETVKLSMSDVRFDQYQNTGAAKGAFDPSSVVMITVLDINGYMSVTEPEIEWTVRGLKGVCK